MKIRNLQIGPDQPCRIIAELGTLHASSYDNCMKATREAIAAGADMVKVQMINPETSWWAGEKQIERYRRLAWPMERWVEYLGEANRISGAPVFSSIFDRSFLSDAIHAVTPAWKLGYKALSMPDLIEKTVQSGKPVIASIAGKDDPLSMKVREQYANSGMLFQYVQPVYPLASQDLKLLPFGQDYLHQGLSIHSKDYRIFAAAMLLGAQTLEVHVQGENAEGFDTSFALNMSELSHVVKIRDYVFKNLSAAGFKNLLETHRDLTAAGLIR